MDTNSSVYAAKRDLDPGNHINKSSVGKKIHYAH